MRREHDSITVDVLDKLSSYLREKGQFHVTVLAARANLPHDRLRTYLDELSTLGFVESGAQPVITLKGQQFLECYRAWVRIQKIYGLDPRAGRGQAMRFLPGGQPLHLLPKSAPPELTPEADVALASPQETPQVDALGVDSHDVEANESSVPVVTTGRSVRAP